MNSKDLSKKIDIEFEELLYQLGVDLNRSSITADKRNREELIEVSKQWLRDKQKIIYSTICGNNDIKKIVLETDDKIKIAVVVGDVLTGLALGVSIATLTAIIVQVGVSNICKEYWEKSKDA